MPYDVFISYRRDESNQPIVKRFVNKLVNAIWDRTGIPKENIAFFDDRAIEVGAQGFHMMNDALRGCKAFVPLCNVPYFDGRSWCGREWELFRRRLESERRRNDASEHMPLILPILWVNAKPIRSFLAEVQFSHESLGSIYARVGLRHLMQQKSREYRFERNEFVMAFAERLINVIHDYPLPPARDEIPPLEEIPNAFIPTPDVSPEVKANRDVQFVIFTATRHEMAEWKSVPEEQLPSYGDRCTEWRPFFPDCDDQIGQLLQDVAIVETRVKCTA